MFRVIRTTCKNTRIVMMTTVMSYATIMYALMFAVVTITITMDGLRKDRTIVVIFITALMRGKLAAIMFMVTVTGALTMATATTMYVVTLTGITGETYVTIVTIMENTMLMHKTISPWP